MTEDRSARLPSEGEEAEGFEDGSSVMVLMEFAECLVFYLDAIIEERFEVDADEINGIKAGWSSLRNQIRGIEEIAI